MTLQIILPAQISFTAETMKNRLIFLIPRNLKYYTIYQRIVQEQPPEIKILFGMRKINDVKTKF